TFVREFLTAGSRPAGKRSHRGAAEARHHCPARMGLPDVHARVGRDARTEPELCERSGQGPMTIKEILERHKNIAVVGLSSQASRPRYSVSQYMQSVGYRIIPVNPNETEVLGEKAYASLDDVPGPIEIVDIFRRPEFVPEIVEAAIRRHARVIWMQLGVVN